MFDTSVFIYALGEDHPYRARCRAVLEDGRRGLLASEVSVELIHEFAYVRLRKGVARRLAAQDARDIAATSQLHVVQEQDIERALDLWSEYEQLDMRDAIFAAQALNRGIDAILSPDKGFDGIPGLQRIDPADVEALASLTR